MSTYPEHDKLRAIQPLSEAQGELLEWLGTQGIQLMKWTWYEDDQRHAWTTNGESINELLARYHGIDLAALEREKRDMLARMR